MWLSLPATTDAGIPRCCWTGCACADRTGTAGWRFLWRKAVKVTLAGNELISTLNAKVDEMSDVLYVVVSCVDVRTVSSAPMRSCVLRGAMSVVACGWGWEDMQIQHVSNSRRPTGRLMITVWAVWVSALKGLFYRDYSPTQCGNLSYAVQSFLTEVT